MLLTLPIALRSLSVEAMAHRLKTAAGKSHHAKRKASVETVFGHLSSNCSRWTLRPLWHKISLKVLGQMSQGASRHGRDCR